MTTAVGDELCLSKWSVSTTTTYITQRRDSSVIERNKSATRERTGTGCSEVTGCPAAANMQVDMR